MLVQRGCTQVWNKWRRKLNGQLADLGSSEKWLLKWCMLEFFFVFLLKKLATIIAAVTAVSRYCCITSVT